MKEGETGSETGREEERTDQMGSGRWGKRVSRDLNL
jgi:hypothetical protein